MAQFKITHERMLYEYLLAKLEELISQKDKDSLDSGIELYLTEKDLRFLTKILKDSNICFYEKE